MVPVGVDVGIRGGAHDELHRLFRHHEFHGQHVLVCAVLYDVQTVVAAHRQFALLVGQREVVVGVGNGRVDGVLIVVDDQVVEAVEPVALEHLGGRRPVVLAAFDVADVAVVVVGELVEADVQTVGGVELHHGQRLPVMVYHGLQRLHLRVVYNIFSCRRQ